MTLIADPALPGKWQSGEEAKYLLLFEGESSLGIQTQYSLVSCLSESLSIPILPIWADTLWNIGLKLELIGKLSTAGDCQEGYWISISETRWANIVSSSVEEGRIKIM